MCIEDNKNLSFLKAVNALLFFLIKNFIGGFCLNPRGGVDSDGVDLLFHKRNVWHDAVIEGIRCDRDCSSCIKTSRLCWRRVV